MPATDNNPDHAISMPPVPVNQHSLAQFYRNGEYSDLKVVSNGFECRVHKIIICSESSVIKDLCRRLGRDESLNLNKYGSRTVRRILDFCYRRTYSDGEYPETVAPFLLSMTAADVRRALEAPLAVVNDVVDLESTGHCTQREEPKEDEEVEDQDEYLSDNCENYDSSDDDFEPLDDEDSLVGVPVERQDPATPARPPYTISLFANFEVYIAAKELQIPALQLLARERFTHTLRAHWDRFAHLDSLIEVVYLRTNHDDPLRALICRIVAAGYDGKYGMVLKDRVRRFMLRNGEFATDVLDTVLRLKREWADME
ncbi:BTB/POZ domain-containing protein 19 [Diaporthe eres]|uniref:BTB/POZ domain-containing protein 19 n=1 Tax=Diaporthe eres TaxID=83184 RepID=A0ABR1P6X1_DIAER